jgi:arginine utilization regulatory protein
MKPYDKIRLFPGVDPATICLLPVLDSFHEGVTITDAQGVVLYMNDAQAKIDDLKVNDAVGKTVTNLYRVDEGTSPTMACLKTGKAIINYACYYRTHLGRIVNSIHNIYPIHADGRIIGAICYITDYKNIEQTFVTVGKTQRSRPVSTFGVSPGKSRPKAQKNGTRFTFEDIIGSDPALLAAVNSAKLASDSPSPIMIYGETGSGKELFAQSIHNRSPRKAKSYVAINCAAIPENLLEGMLFGTSKGAFTGAIDKSGILEAADGGTLFLDEVNSMSLSLQAKLLRFLQERKVRRVGAMREIDVDLKIISSVNMPPRLAVNSGCLRLDLYFRLVVVFIQIPSLRDRMGDMHRLINHFLTKSNAILGKRVSGIDMDLMDRFERYDWPGNVRELEHVIEGAMNMVGDEKTIEMRHLPVPLQSESQTQTSAPPRASADLKNGGRLRIVFPLSSDKIPSANKTLAEIKTEQEVATIVATLADTRGNAAKAARKLGISPQLLNYKLKRFGIDRRAYMANK